MKSILTFTFLFALLSSYAQEGVKFKDISLDEACVIAKTENKIIFIDCYTSWCVPCKKLSKNIFPIHEVGDFYNKYFLSLALDMEKDKDGIKLKNQFNIKAYPTFLFLDSSGDIIHIKVWPGSTKEDIITTGSLALDNSNNYSATIKSINNGERNADAIISYCESRVNNLNIDSLINDYFTNISLDSKFTNSSWKLFDNHVVDIDNSQFDFFLEHRKEYENMIGIVKVKKKIRRIFEYYIYHFNDDKKVMERLKNIDSTLYYHGICWYEYDKARKEYAKDKTNIEKWDILKEKAIVNFSIEGIDYLEGIYCNDLNSYCWFIYEHYKNFNDTNALKYALKLSKKAVVLATNTHYILDTYAHISFDLGNYYEAIKYESKAIELATNENSANVKSYIKALNLFISKNE